MVGVAFLYPPVTKLIPCTAGKVILGSVAPFCLRLMLTENGRWVSVVRIVLASSSVAESINDCCRGGLV